MNKINSDEIIRNTTDAKKRKRINRLKKTFIIAIIILFLIPTVLCIILGIKLNKLQRQFDNLLSDNLSKIELKDQNKKSDNYAYASETVNHVDEIKESEEMILLNNPNDIIWKNENKSETDIIPEESDVSDLDDVTSNKPDNDKLESSYNHNSSEVSEEPLGIYHDKKVYLTFDDGPSKNTDKILDILAEYNVKATFFVVGYTDEKSKERYKRIVDEGHTLGVHSYSHDYKEIYNSLEDFDKDFTKLWKLLYDTTGYMPTLYRFPGGSLNHVSKHEMKDFIRYLNDKGITYFDWNVVNGDAEKEEYTKEQMIDKVLSGVANKKTSIVLMHDTKDKNKTVATLPKILEALISGGAQVLPLDEDAPLIQQIKAASVK